MKHFKLALLLTILISKPLIAQEIVAGPYLQDASPTSIHIMWESDAGMHYELHWGEGMVPDQKTGVTASIVNKAPSQIHRVYLHDLKPSTRYCYKIVWKTGSSDLYSFQTPAVAADEAPFRLVAMSDMQRDNAYPTKFKEIIENGIISYLSDTYSGKDAVHELDMLLIPGDLVADGMKYSDWTEDFFGQSGALFPFVPVYPVLGNHERNTPFYFNYFHLPDNGSPGYLEHWWYKDHGNVRIIGLDSNHGYRIREQLDWLDEVLEEAEEQPDIDFVFAQLHHPHKSELWLDGEIDYTGEIIYRLEQFSSRCGKPSIHFFGHTHGYSRGQSLEHTHLWVNVATAGGRVDGWGEYAQSNYDEFPVTHSDYGFVLMEVEGGDDPNFKLIRVSRGDSKQPLDNEVNDMMHIRRFSTPPDAPHCVSPAAKTKLNAEKVELIASPYLISDQSSEHGESHWQVARTDNFTNPDIEIRQHCEDWYGGVNLNEGIDLTHLKVEGLKPDTEYWWRVRYRSKGLRWSDWSEVEQFSTR